MATLDRAFVKAYLQQAQASRQAGKPRPTVPLSQALEALSQGVPVAEPAPVAASAELAEPPIAAVPAPVEVAPVEVATVAVEPPAPVEPEPVEPAPAEPAAVCETTPEIDAVPIDEPDALDAIAAAVATRAAPSAPPIVQEKAAATVEDFAWPPICEQMNHVAGAQLDLLVDHVMELGCGRGRIVGVLGCTSGSGATTLLLATAQRLAAKNFHVLVADADTEAASVGSRLALTARLGWDTAKQPADALISATARRVSVLPLSEAGPLEDECLAGFAAELGDGRDRFDVTLVNLGAAGGSRSADRVLAAGLGKRLDLLLLVQDLRFPAAESLDAICARLAAAGVARVGVAENFAPSD